MSEPRTRTKYGYDNLNRLSSISYNVGSTGVTATPGVTLTYDQGGAAAFALGRLTSMNDGGGSETYTYNNLGEMTQLQKVISGTTYSTGYAYNLAGQLNSVTYPSGRLVQQSYDTIGRLCAVGTSGSTCTSGTTYATAFSYNAAFQVTGFNYGNGVAAAFGYTSDRLLLQSLAYSKSGTSLFSTNYWYKIDSTNCPNAPAGNNGQIQCITDNVDSGRTVSYTYDSLYRLTSAVTNGSPNYLKWGLTWAYDRYGNRLNQNYTFDSPPTNSLSFANPGGAQTNRPDGMCFDANGNLTAESGTCPPAAPTYSYDAENRLITYSGAAGTYSYDGNNLRAKKVAAGTTTVYIFSGSKVIAEYDNGAAPASPSREYIYSGAMLLAKIEGGASIYYHPDQLSNRVLTDSSGTVLGQRGHYPFGDTWYESGTMTKLKFTTYERDSESGNDYAMMRSYISSFGRFSSPDPIGGSLGNPQSLNRYAYAVNEPIDLIDPTGLDTINLYYCMETENGPYLCIFSDASGAITGLPLIFHPGPGGGGGGSGNGGTTSQTKAQRCANAKAKVEGLKQKAQALNPNKMLNENIKELGSGALIGCAVGALGTEAVTTGGGFIFGNVPGAAVGAVGGIPMAVGNCAVGAIGGLMTAEGVFVISHAGEIANSTSTGVQLIIAEAEAAEACKP